MAEYTHSEIKQKWKKYFEEERYPELVKIGDNYPIERSILVGYEELVIYFGDDFPTFVLYNPKLSLGLAEESILEVLGPSYKDVEIHLRLEKLPEAMHREIRNLRADDLMKFIGISGLVRKVTEVRPRMTVGAFRCKRCGDMTYVEQIGSTMEEPHACGSCEKSASKTTFLLQLDESEFVDYQHMEVQESPEGLRGGDQPQRLKGWIEDDMVGKISPGDRITINGILDGEPKSGRGGKNSRTYNIFIRVNSIEITQYEYQEIKPSDEDLEKINEMSNKENLFKLILDAIAPSIHGLREEKMGLALQLFSGVRKEMPDGQRIRGDIHILLVGDPGTAKSMLLRYISDLTPRGMYASGRGSTGAGLTAAAMKEEVMGESRWTLEAGTLVLADKGIAAIDEIDKMRPEDRSSMHEAMEQQTISIAKAGINARLNSRCSVLGAANPKHGRFEQYENISEQIDLPPPLISRFDLIFIIKDVPNKDVDRNVADHILNIHQEGEKIGAIKGYTPGGVLNPEETGGFSMDLLRKYIAHAKRITPVMTEDSMNKLRDFYLNIRGSGGEEDSIPITARQLESLVRLSESSARAHLRDRVITSDAERAITVTRYFLDKTAATGSGYDIDKVASGVSHSERTVLHKVKEIIKELQEMHEEGASQEDILEKGADMGISREKVHKELKRMRKGGEIYKPKTKEDRYLLT